MLKSLVDENGILTVVSHDEALYHYGLVDREPSQPTITVYSGYNKNSLKKSRIKA